MQEFIITKAKIFYPAIYEPRTAPFENSKPRYSVCFLTDDEEAVNKLTELGILPSNRNELYHTINAYGPSIKEKYGNYKHMTEIFQIADVRNIKRDKLFMNIEAELKVRVFKCDKYGYEGNALSLLAIIIKADDLAANLNKI